MPPLGARLRAPAGCGRRSVNLACSGARSADVALGGGRHYGEASQAERLGGLARQYRVTTVMLQVGANDDRRWSRPGSPASAPSSTPPARLPRDIGPSGRRLAAMAPKVEAAVADVRAAMRRAGYSDADYAFVLASYASRSPSAWSACPPPRAAPTAAPTPRGAGPWRSPSCRDPARGRGRAGARFLDLTRATEGYEACSRSRREEWQRRLTVDPRRCARRAGRARLAPGAGVVPPQRPRARRVGRCLGEFVRSGAAAACLVGATGTCTPQRRRR